MDDYFSFSSYRARDYLFSTNLLGRSSFFHSHFISDDREVLGHIDEADFNSSKVTLKVSK